MTKKIFLFSLIVLYVTIMLSAISATPIQDLMSNEATNLKISIGENETLINFYLDTSGYSWDSSQELSFGEYSMTLPPSFVLDNINLREDFNKTTNKITFSEVYISPAISWLLDFVLSDYGLTSQQINENNSILTNLASQYVQNITGNSYFKKQGRNYQIWYDKGWGSISESDINKSQDCLNNVYSYNINKTIVESIYSLNPKLLIKNYIIPYIENDLTGYLNEINYSIDGINFTGDFNNYTVKVGGIILRDGNYSVNVKIIDNTHGEEVDKTIYVNLWGFTYCIPNLTYSEWGNWEDNEICQQDNFLTQSRSRFLSDSNNCKESNKLDLHFYDKEGNEIDTPEWFFSDTTETEYREVTCDFCIPNLVYLNWTVWGNLSCNNNLMNQSRSRILSDVNSCGEVEDEYFFEYRNSEICGITNETNVNYTYFLNGSNTFDKIEGLEIGTNITIESSDISNFSIPNNLIGLEIFNISAGKNTSGTVYFRINNSKVIEPTKVSLYVLESSWVKLNTNYLSSIGGYLYYSAYTPHFSIFMIGEEKIISNNNGNSGSSSSHHHSSSSTGTVSSSSNVTNTPCSGSSCNITKVDNTPINLNEKEKDKDNSQIILYVFVILLILISMIFVIIQIKKGKNKQKDLSR